MYVIIRHMKRTTVFLDEAIESDLQVLAKTSGRPFSSLVREAISEYVRIRLRRGGRELSFVGVGRSGRRNTAERHEEILWSDLQVDPHSESDAGKKNKRTRLRRSPAD